jgi:AraC-like DNA-binding protein
MYAEFVPAGALADVLTCEWVRTCGPEGDILVLPDGCVDIVWRSDGELFIAGPDRGPVAHHHPAGTEFVGLRLKPGTAATVLGVGVDELCDQQLPLSSLWGRPADRLSDLLMKVKEQTQRRRVLATEVIGRVANAALDTQVIAAASVLARPTLSVADLGECIGLGARQLRRRFVQQVGYGPKTYERVMRFRRFLAFAHASRPPPDGLAVLAFAAGYADQAHLTRECRRLADRTPAQLLGDRILQDGEPRRRGPLAP